MVVTVLLLLRSFTHSRKETLVPRMVRRMATLRQVKRERRLTQDKKSGTSSAAGVVGRCRALFSHRVHSCFSGSIPFSLYRYGVNMIHPYFFSPFFSSPWPFPFPFPSPSPSKSSNAFSASTFPSYSTSSTHCFARKTFHVNAPAVPRNAAKEIALLIMPQSVIPVRYFNQGVMSKRRSS
jgi:hypothetical protein